MFTDLHFEQGKFSVRVNSEKNPCKSQQQTANYNREEISFLAGSFLFPWSLERDNNNGSKKALLWREFPLWNPKSPDRRIGHEPIAKIHVTEVTHRHFMRARISGQIFSSKIFRQYLDALTFSDGPTSSLWNPKSPDRRIGHEPIAKMYVKEVIHRRFVRALISGQRFLVGRPQTFRLTHRSR